MSNKLSIPEAFESLVKGLLTLGLLVGGLAHDFKSLLT